MRLNTRADKVKSRLSPFLAAIVLIAMLGCSQKPQPDDEASTPSTPSIPGGGGGEVQAIDTPPSAGPQVSFENYALPIPCKRTSDSRDTTPGGLHKNVIVFNCRSHDVPSASQAIREHMVGGGYSLSDETPSSGASVSFVAKRPGTYKTTIRIVPDKNDSTKSVVRVQWFSKD